jgi:mRNA interferase MazF
MQCLPRADRLHYQSMAKQFDDWNILKKVIDNTSSLVGFSQREIWWCRIGVNVGFEEDGKSQQFSRPVLVLRKFNKHFFLGIPLTTSVKRNNPYYHVFTFQGQDISALLSQTRPYDAKRLTDRIGQVPEQTFGEIKEAFKTML